MSTPTNSADGRLLAHEVAGTGDTTVVCLHGVFMDRTLWRDVDLSGVRRIDVDMPGHGDSPLDPGASIDDHVAAVQQLLDRHALDAPILIGHSWGGMVALRLAQRRRLGGIVFTNTPLRRTTGTSRLGFHLQRAMLAAGLPPRTYGKLAVKALIGNATLHRRPELIDQAANRAHRIGRTGLRATLRSVLLDTDDTLDLLAVLDVPWTFIAGRDDYVIAGGVAEQIQRHGPLHLVDGAHTSPLEAPDQLAATITDFLEHTG